MLVKVRKALLLSDVKSFVDMYKELADDMDVELRVESTWNTVYRITEDVVILGTKFLDKINKAYYPKAAVILKEGENPFPYIKEGITRFVFNHKNKYELLMSFFRTEKEVIRATSKEMETLLKATDVQSFIFGDYDFRFDEDRFKYKNKAIYMTLATKVYLAEWLLNGRKNNSRRMLLCNLRKRLGEGFLKDVDRYGQYRGGKR